MCEIDISLTTENRSFSRCHGLRNYYLWDHPTNEFAGRCNHAYFAKIGDHACMLCVLGSHWMAGLPGSQHMPGPHSGTIYGSFSLMRPAQKRRSKFRCCYWWSGSCHLSTTPFWWKSGRILRKGKACKNLTKRYRMYLNLLTANSFTHFGEIIFFPVRLSTWKESWYKTF